MDLLASYRNQSGGSTITFSNIDTAGTYKTLWIFGSITPWYDGNLGQPTLYMKPDSWTGTSYYSGSYATTGGSWSASAFTGAGNATFPNAMGSSYFLSTSNTRFDFHMQILNRGTGLRPTILFTSGAQHASSGDNIICTRYNSIFLDSSLTFTSLTFSSTVGQFDSTTTIDIYGVK